MNVSIEDNEGVEANLNVHDDIVKTLFEKSMKEF